MNDARLEKDPVVTSRNFRRVADIVLLNIPET